tara:strand:- start:5421 stop:7064 length:1644 start_codon:yes stop_codon:yes gene_type:complete
MALPFIGPASLNPQQGGGGGITSIKLNPAQVRFPTSRYTPQRRPLEPTSKETFAPLAPLLMEGIFSAFQKQPERLTNEQYLESIGADPQDPTKLEQTQLDAYNLYGPRSDPNTFGLDEVANIVAASQMGRGAKDYANTYLNLRKAKSASDARTDAARSSYISTQMTPRNQSVLLMDKDAAAAGNAADMYYMGQFDPQGSFQYFNEETRQFEDVANSGKNLVQAKSFLEGTGGNPFTDKAKTKALEEYQALDGTLQAQQQALTGVTVAINETVDALDVAIDDPKYNPVSFVSSLTNMANSALNNFDQVGSMLGGGNIDNYFADAADVNAGIGGTRTREGTGDNAKALYEAIKKGDETQIQIEIKRFEEANAGYLETLGIRDLFEEIGYQNVRAQANLLSLAYQAAAANGQTGRTLSDKDLAFHLQMVGFGATQDPQILKDNLLAFGDQLIQRADEQAMKGYGRLIKSEISEYKEDKDFRRFMKRWYSEDDDFETYLDFYTRNPDVPSIEKFKGYERRKSKKEQIDEQRRKDKTFESIDLTVPPGSIVS